jgi:hypothetical protein
VKSAGAIFGALECAKRRDRHDLRLLPVGPYFLRDITAAEHLDSRPGS